jgi:hypothetical protein
MPRRPWESSVPRPSRLLKALEKELAIIDTDVDDAMVALTD